VSAVYLQQFPSTVIRTIIAKKSSFLRTPAFIFCLPWGRPCGNHAKRCANEKIQCLPNPSQHVPIYLQLFPSYTMFKSMCKSKNCYFYHIMVSLGTPWGNHAKRCINEKTIQCLPNSRSMYPSIFKSFPVIRTASEKVAVFTYRSPHFCFPWRRPCDYHAICSMDGKTIQCLPNPSHAKPLAACTYLSSIVSELYDVLRKSKKSLFLPHFCFPWRRPCDCHAICCMDEKSIQCLPNPSQHVPIYIQ